MPVSPPLTVKESDDSVTVRPANVLSFNAADFTVAGSGDTATISIDATGAGASLTDTYIGFGNASDLLTGSADFTYVASSGTWTFQDADRATISLKGTQTSDATAYTQIAAANAGDSVASVAFHRDGAADASSIRFATQPTGSTTVTERMRIASTGNVGIGGAPDSGVERLHVLGTDATKDLVVLESTDSTDADDGPDLVLFRNKNSPVNGTQLGSLRFRGRNNTPTDVEYAQIEAEVESGFGGSENGSLRLGVMADGSMIDSIYVDGSGASPIVGIGTAPTSGFSGAVPRVHVLQPDNGIGILVEDNQADADVGPQIVWYRNSASPAADDILGRLRWEGKDSGGNIHMYGRQTNEIVSPTDGSESGRMIWESRSGGTLYETMRFEGNDITFNYGASNAVDLLIKGDNDNIFFADASQDNCGVGTSAPASDVERLHIKGTGVGTDIVRIETEDDGAASGPHIQIYRNSATPTNGDDCGEIFFTGNHAATSGAAEAGKENYGRIRLDTVNVVTGSEDGLLLFDVTMGGTLTEFIRLNAAGGSGYIVFNEGSKNIDVRMESDGNSTMFKLDAGLDLVGIGAAPTSGGAQLQVDEDASFLSYFANQNTSGAVDASLNKNGHIVCNPTGGNITVTLGAQGAVGEKVTIMNTSGDASTVLFAVAVGDSTLTTPATFASGDSETWFCYKDLNWMRINSQT